MKPFVCTTFVILRLVLLHAVATEIGCKPSISEKNAGKAISRGEPHTGVSFVNFKEDKFSYLNITILGYSHVDWMPQCSFACLETPTCFSYNLAAYPNINGKLLCELLPSDKYNNSDKFIVNESFHHFSIASPCSGWPCKNNGTCLPLYEENSYKCFCKAGFAGRDCENACVFAFDSQLSASSQWDSSSAPSQGKLNYQETREKAGAWVALENNSSQWLQVDLGSQKRVRTLATQGRNYSLDWPGYHAQWVTKYKLEYSNDGEDFQYYQEQGVAKEFAGNIDRDTEVRHDLNPLISARYFRFRPTGWHGHLSMRVGLLGCPDR